MSTECLLHDFYGLIILSNLEPASALRRKYRQQIDADTSALPLDSVVRKSRLLLPDIVCDRLYSLKHGIPNFSSSSL